MNPTNDSSSNSPEFHRTSLDNGGTLLHESRKTPPVVALKVFLPVGSAHDPEGAEGLAHLTAESLISHTKQRTLTEMNRYQSRHGFKLSSSVKPDYTVLSFRSLEEHGERLLKLAREILTEPAFDPDAVDHLRTQQESALGQRRDDTFRHAFDRALEEFYGGHPYAHPSLGTRGSLDELTTDRLRSFFTERYSEDDLVVSSVGTLDGETLRATFGDVDLPGETPAVVDRDPRVPRDTRVTITRPVDQPTHVMVYPADSLDRPSYVPLKVTEALLGGGMGSVLFRRMREERSLGYQVGASYPSRRGPATIRFYLGGGSPEGTEFRSILGDVLEELAEEGPSEDELHKAREYRKGRFRLDHESPAKVAWYRGFYETMGLGAKFDRTYTDAVDEVTPETVRRVARKLRNSTPLHLTVLPEEPRD